MEGNRTICCCDYVVQEWWLDQNLLAGSKQNLKTTYEFWVQLGDLGDVY